MFLGILVIDRYNKCVFHRDKVLDKYNTIDKLLMEREDIIDKIMNVIKDYDLHEDSILRDLNKYKKSLNKEKDVNERLLFIDNDIIDKAINLKNVYKKAGKMIVDIEKDYSNNNSKIDYALDIYNEEVLNYSNYLDNKFNRWVFEKFKFYTYNCYER